MKNYEHNQTSRYKDNILMKTVFTFLALFAFSLAQAQVKLLVAPAEKVVTEGDVFTLEVNVETGTQPLDGANIFLAFNPAVLQVQSATAGSGLPVPLSPVSFDNTTGLVSYAYGAFSNFPSGNFNLFTIEVKATGSGVSVLSFVSSNGIDTELSYSGQPVPAEQVNGKATSSPSSAPLPVTLLYFKGRSTAAGNQLSWATATEDNSSHFVVERSGNGSNFTAIATLQAAGLSRQQILYTYADKASATLTGTHYYRLKQVDLDGTFEYSFMIALDNQAAARAGIIAYPNPFTDALTLALPRGTTAETAEVLLTTLEGKILYQARMTLPDGEKNIVLTGLPVISAGLYLVRLQLDEELYLLKLTKR
ncbi:T9SS type A sorting domain-containing protein [Botryobacter ruber]|uniref:T9SS type A sorting domain-containing protein n=1 Tax=Botryobacter ruber TaxID=2171629 RepID=UPI000E0C72BA|nr:T9SS type A sorting domain-containing protein [Botryobacter ruber]